MEKVVGEQGLALWSWNMNGLHYNSMELVGPKPGMTF